MTAQPAFLKRDYSIDCLRGLALLFVLIDHVEAVNSLSFVSVWTPHALGYSDMAEVFVFLSGYCYGMVYGPRMTEFGWKCCFRRAWIRSATIWISYLLAYGCLVGIAQLTNVPLSGNAPLSGTSGFGAALGGSGFRWASWLGLTNHPFGFGILALYVVLMPLAPFIMIGLQRRFSWVMIASFSLYTCMQLFSFIGVETWPKSIGWYFDPFAWQLLFVSAIYMGYRGGEIKTSRSTDNESMQSKTAKEAQRSPLGHRLTLALNGLAVVVVVIGFAGAKNDWIGDPALRPESFTSVQEALNQLFGWLRRLADARSLGPVRLAHFIAIAWLLQRWLRPFFVGKHDPAFPMSIQFFIRLGQSSLAAYCSGLVLTFLSMQILPWSDQQLITVAIFHVNLIGLMYLVTEVLGRKRTVVLHTGLI